MRTFNLLVAVFALVQLARYARPGLLFLAPVVRVEGVPEAEGRSTESLRLGATLEELGFALLGVLHQRAALGAFTSEADVYASSSGAAFADIEEGGARGPRVQFFTPFGDGAAVLTAGFERPSIVTPRLEAAGMPEAPLEDVLAAHELAVRRLSLTHGPPRVSMDLEARVAAARSFYAKEGRRDLRRGKALPFALLIFALVLLASALKFLLLGAKT
ncbi:MAG TPA: hypothetical protein VLV17_04245 [Anaeromyxobacteraceae bacterium]|nr:hypothetical protein [Anaeromyxobacteraceae bacterium]